MSNTSKIAQKIQSAVDFGDNLMTHLDTTDSFTVGPKELEMRPEAVKFGIEDMPTFKWEKDFISGEDFQDKFNRKCVGIAFAVVAFDKASNGTVTMPASIKAAKDKTPSKYKGKIGDNGVFSPDFVEGLGFYKVTGHTVVLPEYSQIPFVSSKVDTEERVMLSFGNSAKENEDWQVELEIQVNRLASQLPVGPFVVLIKAGVTKRRKLEEGIFSMVIEIGSFTMSALTLVVQDIRRPKEMPDAKMKRLLAAQLKISKSKETEIKVEVTGVRKPATETVLPVSPPPVVVSEVAPIAPTAMTSQSLMEEAGSSDFEL